MMLTFESRQHKTNMVEEILNSNLLEAPQGYEVNHLLVDAQKNSQLIDGPKLTLKISFHEVKDIML